MRAKCVGELRVASVVRHAALKLMRNANAVRTVTASVNVRCSRVSNGTTVDPITEHAWTAADRDGDDTERPSSDATGPRTMSTTDPRPNRDCSPASSAAHGSVPDNVGEICNVHVFPGFREDEQEAVDMLMEGIPAKGGNVSHYVLEKLIRAAFRGGVASAKLKAPNAKLTDRRNEHEQTKNRQG